MYIKYHIYEQRTGLMAHWSSTQPESSTPRGAGGAMCVYDKQLTSKHAHAGHSTSFTRVTSHKTRAIRTNHQGLGVA